MISSGKRPELLRQTLTSIRENAASKHHVTLVLDGYENQTSLIGIDLLRDVDSVIVNTTSLGASASRNVGAGSIPKYRRKANLCFFDDDVYAAAKGWDLKLEYALLAMPHLVISGHAHPYNHPTGQLYNLPLEKTEVLSTVQMAMAWEAWDNVGPWCEPGGPGGSEDYEWCMRAVKKSYGLVVTVPQCILHTGITSSTGKPIIGADQVAERNRELEKIHGIEGRVIYQ